MKVLGLMSGTSMDGLDCCLAEIALDSNYNFVYRILNSKCYDFSLKTRSIIHDYIFYNKYSINYIDNYLGELFSKYCIKFLKNNKVDLIALHGQTVKHIDGECSIQIGNPKIMNNNLNLPIVYNFRNADILNGGNGAPLVPFLDWLFFRKKEFNIIALNLGGISNISVINQDCSKNDVIGFDTGPGMALSDECCNKFYNEPIDMDGVHAKQGKVNEDILSELMGHKFIQKMPPKSTGRHEYGKELLSNIIQNYSQTSPDDMIRTFCIFTAKSIAENLNKFLNFNTADVLLIISGGGVHHPVLMEDIQRYTEISDLQTTDVLEMEPNMKEALLIAVIGVARIQGMIANMPTVTGAKNMVMLGDLVQY